MKSCRCKPRTGTVQDRTTRTRFCSAVLGRIAVREYWVLFCDEDDVGIKLLGLFFFGGEV